MHRRKKEKSVLRMEGKVHVLNVFVKVPSGAAAPIKYKPMEVDAINQAADGRQQGRRVTFICNSPPFDGRRRVWKAGPSEPKPQDRKWMSAVKNNVNATVC